MVEPVQTVTTASTHSGPNWTVVGVLLTALFTGLILSIAWLSYRHDLRRAGLRKPIVIKGGRSVLGAHLFGDESGWTKYFVGEAAPKHMVAPVYMFNHSDQDQTVVIDAKRSKVVWPRTRKRVRVIRREVVLAAHRGGNVAILLRNDSGQWPHDERSVDNDAVLRWPYVLRLRVVTTSGHNVTFLGRTRVMTIPVSLP
jgi:hypothetical protein